MPARMKASISALKTGLVHVVLLVGCVLLAGCAARPVPAAGNALAVPVAGTDWRQAAMPVLSGAQLAATTSGGSVTGNVSLEGSTILLSGTTPPIRPVPAGSSAVSAYSVAANVTVNR